MDYEPKQTNTKKRVRASQACIHCRKKKIKCDETKPTCLQCQEANVACEYTEPKKRGPRKGYVQLLEERLAHMERRLLGPTIVPHSDAPSPSMMPSYPDTDTTSDLPPLDRVNHLVDLFFQNVNSVFPFIHRHLLKKSILDGTVSRPLLYSVLAVGARFSQHPAIRTNPPYLAGEAYAEKAISLVDADMLQPTIENIQFWGIMSCLEYGRASGSKAWIYGGLAIRFCQELGLYKEEVISTPILSKDGSIDTVAMAFRRRIYWSCLCIDKLASAGTRRPQCMERSDCDTNPASVADSLLLRDQNYHCNAEGDKITDDSLMDIAKHFMRMIEIYGEVNRFMNRAKSNSASIVWPPIPEFRNLEHQLLSWKDRLPPLFQFNQTNLDHHVHHASRIYLNIWLSAHAIWCSSTMILHRGSLALIDSLDTLTNYRGIQASIETCRACVELAMSLFSAIKDHCGHNTLPYMGYSAYVFATVLMTSSFSGTPESCQKSSRGLRVLYDLIDCMAPYWPMCERLAKATKELLVTHQRLYQPAYPTSSPSLSMLLTGPSFLSTYEQNTVQRPTAEGGGGFYVPLTEQQQQNNRGNEIDFNSLEFLYDTDLFGQAIFDVQTTTTTSMTPPSIPHSAFRTLMPHTQPYP